MKRSPAVLLLLALAFSACTTATTTPAAPKEPVRVLIVGTTDVHGWFNGHVETPVAGGAGVHYGGLAVLASYVDVLRKSNGGRLLLVDSGDMFQGTLESNMFEGEAVVHGYNALGYTAAAVGNHEFDFGPVGPAAVPRSAQDDPLGALKRSARIARFPLLSANMTDKATGKTPEWARPYTMVDVGGAKIGIIGLTTPDTPNVTMLANVRTLEFGDPREATIRAATELREKGADAVIVIAHMGGRCSNLHDVQDAAGCESQHEANKLLTVLPPGTIDAYFAGHTHAQMRNIINGVPAMQAKPYSSDFSTLELFIDPAAHRVVTEKTVMREHTMICSYVYDGTDRCDPRGPKAGVELVQRVFEGVPIVPKVSVAAMFEPYLQKVAAKRHEKLGIRTAKAFTRSYSSESPLGNLLAEALREGTGSDIAFMNSGGIRAELRAGDLVYSDIFEVSPFDNYPTVATVTGAQLLEILRLTSTGERGLLQTSGLRYTIDARKDLDKPGPQRNRIVAATLEDGTPIDPARSYRVALPDFLAAGGDGLMPVMSAVPAGNVVTDLERPLRDLFAAVLARRAQPLEPKVDGRVTIINSEQPAR